jgi:hypothetical protein
MLGRRHLLALAIASFPALIAAACASTGSTGADLPLGGDQPLGAACDPALASPCLRGKDACRIYACDPEHRVCAVRASDAGLCSAGGATCAGGCEAGTTCLADACRSPCTSGADCADGGACNAGSVCLPPPGCDAVDGAGGVDCGAVCYGWCATAALAEGG